MTTRTLDMANVIASDVTIAGDKTFTGDIIPSSPLSHRNLIINGAMMVDQRDTSSATTANATYKIDRFKTYYGNGPVHSVQRVTDTPTNLSDFFKHSMKIVQTTASGTSTPGTNDYNFFQYGIEGQDMAHLRFGASQAQTFTMSFYVKSSVAGVYSVGLNNASFNRSFSKKYTITSANTWERITLTFTGDTTGTWASDNTAGLYIRWNLGGGTDRTAAEGSWTSGYQDGADGSTGANSFSNTLNAEYYITGVQLELGDNATPFEHRSYGEEFNKCTRYFQHFGPSADGGTNFWGAGQWSSSTIAHIIFNTLGPMRADPTASKSTVGHFRMGNASMSGVQPLSDMTFLLSGTSVTCKMRLYCTASSGSAGNGTVLLSYNGSNVGTISLDSEL